jgi:hypothetical protein
VGQDGSDEVGAETALILADARFVLCGGCFKGSGSARDLGCRRAHFLGALRYAINDELMPRLARWFRLSES